MPETLPAPSHSYALAPALDEFWGRWSAAGYRLTPGEWLQVEALLRQVTTEETSPEMVRLGGLLCPLVARDSEAQRRFRNLWRDCYDRLSPPALESTPSPPPEPKRPWWRRRSWWRQNGWLVLTATLILLIGLGAGVEFSRRHPAPTPTPSVAPPATPDSVATPPPSPSPGAASPAPTPKPEVLTLSTKSVKSDPWKLPWTATLGLIPLVGALLWREARSRRRQTGQTKTLSEFHWPLKLPESEREILGPDAGWVFLPSEVATGKAATLPLHVRRSGVSSERVEGERLSAEKTIEATLSAGGLPRLVYEKRVRHRSIVALVEYANLYDHRMPYYLSLLRRLERLGAEVRVFAVAEGSLYGFPLTNLGTKKEKAVPLSILLQSFARSESILLYCGEGDLLTEGQEPIGYVLTEAGRKLADGWQQAALVTLSPPRTSEEALRRAFTVVGASWNGIERFLSPAGSAALPKERTERRFDPSLFETDDPGVAKTLFWSLPPGAYHWLCACAALPELRWDLTLDLGRTLDASLSSEPVSTEANLAALLELPWFGGTGQLPPRLRAALEEELPRPLHERALAILKASPPPDKTWAQVAHRMERAVQEHQTGRVEAFEESVAAVQSQVGEKTILKNRRLRSIFSRAYRTPLAWLHQSGVSLLGPNVGLVLLSAFLAGLALGALLVRFTPDASPIVLKKRFHEVPDLPTTPLDFGPTLPGSKMVKTFVLKNDSGQEQKISVAVEGKTGTWKLESGTDGFTLAKGASQEISIALTTKASAPKSLEGTLKVSVEGTATPFSIPLTAGATDGIRVSPGSLDFGTGVQGTPKSLPLTIRNASDRVSVELRGLELAKNSGNEFTVENPQKLPLTLKPGENQILSVRFERKQVGAFQSTLRIRSGIVGSGDAPTQDVPLRGQTTAKPTVATQSPLKLPVALDFGNDVQGTEATKPVTIQNQSTTAAVELRRFDFEDNSTKEFALNAPPTLPRLLQPGESYDLPLLYHRGYVGKHNAVLRVHSGLPGAPDFPPDLVVLNGMATNKRIEPTPSAPKPPDYFDLRQNLAIIAKETSRYFATQPGYEGFTSDPNKDLYVVTRALVEMARASGKNPTLFDSFVRNPINNSSKYFVQGSLPSEILELPPTSNERMEIWQRVFALATEYNNKPLPTSKSATPNPTPGSITIAMAAANARKNSAPKLAAYLEKFVAIPAGSFQMGSDKYDDEKPIHRVTLSAYSMGQTEVTVGMWREYVETVNGKMPDAPSFNQGWKLGDHPIVRVGWDDCVAFCRWASTASGMNLQLPTEAQWEYAAGGPKSLIYPWGNEWDESKAVANARGTAPVGSKLTDRSPFGLLDMAGNAWEWCSDWYDDKYYSRKEASALDPVGASSGAGRVIRGGSWNFGDADFFRCAFRSGVAPEDRDYFYGFRLASPGP